MKQSGRVHILTVAAIAGLIVIAVMMLFSRESLSSVGARFMTALSKGDVDTLTKMSYMGDETPDEIHKQWDFAVNTSGKHYRFIWNIVAATAADDNTGSVRLQVQRNADQPGAYDENFALPMKKQNGEWLVDVGAISHEMFPGLPRKRS
jgi:hypothetical protein